jgi:hypothetical protein
VANKPRQSKHYPAESGFASRMRAALGSRANVECPRTRESDAARRTNGEFVLQCEKILLLPAISNPRCTESLIGDQLYQMLILEARTRSETAKTAGHSTWRKRLALISAGIDFPSL